MLAYNGDSLGTLLRNEDKPREVDRPWGLFTDFVSTLGNQKTTVNQTGYDFTIFGFNSGVDYRFRDDLMVGAGTGFYNTAASFKNSGGSGTVNSIPFYLYGTYYPGAFYMMGSLGYTLNLYDLERQISFGGINRTAKSSVDGSQLNVFGEAGYDITMQRVIVTPAVSLAYSQVWVGGFTESGAGSLDLQVDAQSADSLQSGVGARVSIPFKTGDTQVLPQLSAFYQHEFSNNSRGLDASLNQAGTSFTFRTNSPGRDFALLGAGVAVGLKQNLYLQANYNVEVGRTNYTAHNVYAGVRWEF
jgi:outer membrane autotransporter protein